MPLVSAYEAHPRAAFLALQRLTIGVFSNHFSLAALLGAVAKQMICLFRILLNKLGELLQDFRLVAEQLLQSNWLGHLSAFVLKAGDFVDFCLIYIHSKGFFSAIPTNLMSALKTEALVGV